MRILILKGGTNGNSLLHEVQEEARNQEPEESDAQEPQTGNTRCLPGVRHQSVQNRETLGF
jgi:hypothetical protein